MYLKKLILPLFIAIAGVSLAAVTLPLGASARVELPLAADTQIEASALPVVLSGSDIDLSGAGASSPEIAANGTFVGVVYRQGNNIFLRAAQTKWMTAQQLNTDGNAGDFPRLAFDPSNAARLHIVWTGASSGVPQQVIRHRLCTLAEPTFTCGNVNNVTGVATATLASPDVAVDGSGHVHVAWIDQATGKVTSARSTTDGASWTTVAQISTVGGTNADKLALAFADSSTDYLHLVFRDFNVGATGRWSLEYYRSEVGSHNWSTVGGFRFTEVLNHGEIDNPTIAASGSRVFVSWDTEKDSTNRLFALIGSESTNNGNDWAAVGMREITSTLLVDLNLTQPGLERRSKNSVAGDAVPVSAEEDLRPSVVYSTSTAAAVVWQEWHPQGNPNTNCGDPGNDIPATSQIHFASNSGDNWATVGVLSNNTNLYHIDPDIAVDNSGGVRTHVVFMRGPDNGDCSGPGAGNYTIYYRGPITDKFPENGIFLPLILKNG